ncbi:MAG: UvrB/UvrC motif-containing protein, partial [Parcubacteria group bacterium]|nr:UvrB/UvrC motif-containing protein [Parcubacteria group bacterium]
VLGGQSKRVIRQLEQEMQQFADLKAFESAKVRRDQIRSLQKFSQRQKISMYRLYNEDVLHFIDVGQKTYLQLFRVEKGQVSGKQEFIFDSQPEVAESFIRQYYATNEIPDKLLVPTRLADHDLLEQYLTKVKGKPVQIEVPRIGQKKKLLDMVYKNVLYAADQDDQALIRLREALNLTGVPYVIECFDISTILGEYTVASMVQFRGGMPDKNNYRRFKIKTVQGQDDFASMGEVVRRRYRRLVGEGSPFPNLIVIDGGRGQLSAAWEVLKELGLAIPIIGLAKREEEIYRIEREDPLRLPHTNPGLQLLQRIRNEAHRFAITYHRLLRGKGMLKNKL